MNLVNKVRQKALQECGTLHQWQCRALFYLLLFLFSCVLVSLNHWTSTLWTFQPRQVLSMQKLLPYSNRLIWIWLRSLALFVGSVNGNLLLSFITRWTEMHKSTNLSWWDNYTSKDKESTITVNVQILCDCSHTLVKFLYEERDKKVLRCLLRQLSPAVHLRFHCFLIHFTRVYGRRLKAFFNFYTVL